MQKITKKALEYAFKNDYLLGSDFLNITSVSRDGERKIFYIHFKEYQLAIIEFKSGYGGWFSGCTSLSRVNRLNKIIEGFNNECFN